MYLILNSPKSDDVKKCRNNNKNNNSDNPLTSHRSDGGKIRTFDCQPNLSNTLAVRDLSNRPLGQRSREEEEEEEGKGLACGVGEIWQVRDSNSQNSRKGKLYCVFTIRY